MVEKETLVRRLTLLQEYYSDLAKAYQDFNLEDFSTNKIVRRYVERTLHIAIESCLDIANHIISYEGYREPKDNKDTFEVLFEQKILDNELTNNLKKMAQCRNIIVHDYIRIQPEIVYSIVQNNLVDLLSFARIINDRFL